MDDDVIIDAPRIELLFKIRKRCNLTVLCEPDMEWLPAFLAKQRVRVVEHLVPARRAKVLVHAAEVALKLGVGVARSAAQREHAADRAPPPFAAMFFAQACKTRNAPTTLMSITL